MRLPPMSYSILTNPEKLYDNNITSDFYFAPPSVCLPTQCFYNRHVMITIRIGTRQWSSIDIFEGPAR